MHSDGSALQRLSRDECLTLMASVLVGRIIYTRRALPAVELVNFAWLETIGLRSWAPGHGTTSSASRRSC